MRVLMTRCVGQAWATICQERREVVVKSFRQLGISLPINRSSDGELSIKGLSTGRLITAMMDWKTRGVQTGNAEDSEDSETESEVNDVDDEDDDWSSILPGRGGRQPSSSSPSEELEISSITNNNSPSSALAGSALSSKAPERGRDSKQRGRPSGSRTERRGRKPASTNPSEDPKTLLRGSRTKRGGRKPASTGPSKEPETSSITNNDIPGLALAGSRLLQKAQSEVGALGEEVSHVDRTQNVVVGNLLQPGLLKSWKPRQSPTMTHLARRLSRKPRRSQTKTHPARRLLARRLLARHSLEVGGLPGKRLLYMMCLVTLKTRMMG
ncbi:hypothetical protein FN846DRAFT_979530 [Sphaerosporella brunnea]|uniref:Uncharacterized protein n=1 Tax=Sphaerosporella brunnea TaxID=1250544 RepID=A0A5J5EDH8_9PEZI|nr:hypothetical protein FN846DRAFT_979530 [Sphaerosporella brunnea]